MKIKKEHLALGAIAAFLLTRESSAPSLGGGSPGLVASPDTTPQGMIAQSGEQQGAVGEANNAALQSPISPSQRTPDILQNIASGLNAYIQKATGTAQNYVQYQNLGGIQTLKPSANIPSELSGALSRAIEQEAVAQYGASGGMSLLGGGVAYIPPEQAVVSSANIAQHQAAGTASPPQYSSSVDTGGGVGFTNTTNPASQYYVG